jgi:hypothetical protein
LSGYVRGNILFRDVVACIIAIEIWDIKKAAYDTARVCIMCRQCPKIIGNVLGVRDVGLFGYVNGILRGEDLRNVRSTETQHP